MDVRCWGATELQQREREIDALLLGACRAPGAGCNITSHTQPLKLSTYVRFLLPLRLAPPPLSSLPSSSFHFPPPPLIQPPLNLSQKGFPHELDPLSCAQTTPRFVAAAFYKKGIFHGLLFFHFFLGEWGVHENNMIINRTCALCQWDLKAGWRVW